MSNMGKFGRARAETGTLLCTSFDLVKGKYICFNSIHFMKLSKKS